MAHLKLRGKDLKRLGYPSGEIMNMAMIVMHKNHKHTSKDEVLMLLAALIKTPKNYEFDKILGPIATRLLPQEELEKPSINLLNENVLPYPIYGKDQIQESAIEQMDTAMRLPVSVGGALMPDAHHGYGLPIGGVLATKNAIIPYAVGMDIGCRMCLSVFPLPVSQLEFKNLDLKDSLKRNTAFGKDILDQRFEDEVLDRKEFGEIAIVKKLKDKAHRQIGSSGSGNHFVEYGAVEITSPLNELNLPVGKYLGLLSHSGSRGLGAGIAQHYTKVAMQKCQLPKEAKHLAWLDLDTEAGMEYWIAMNLAGDYAAACHHHIHRRLAATLGTQAIAVIENHHNFAWKEKLEDGTPIIVHRKGATPAGKDVLGIIPGSMTAPGYIVKGKGNFQALNSASHGAGRAMSRQKAKNSFTRKEVKQYLKKHKVELIGGGVDEAPFAYKDIEKVMRKQSNLVEVVGSFLPKIVRMDK